MNSIPTYLFYSEVWLQANAPQKFTCSFLLVARNSASALTQTSNFHSIFYSISYIFHLLKDIDMNGRIFGRIIHTIQEFQEIKIFVNDD